MGSVESAPFIGCEAPKGVTSGGPQKPRKFGLSALNAWLGVRKGPPEMRGALVGHVGSAEKGGPEEDPLVGSPRWWRGLQLLAVLTPHQNLQPVPGSLWSPKLGTKKKTQPAWGQGVVSSALQSFPLRPAVWGTGPTI